MPAFGGGRGASVRRVRDKKRALVSSYKAVRGCSRCDEDHPACLDLHHLDPAMKNPKLTKQKANGRHHTGGSRWENLSFIDLAEELAKCEVLCSNCHRKETALTFGWRHAYRELTLF